MEENEVIGRYLKPLVWDNAFLAHSDFSKYIAPLESPDFAASVARFGHDVSVANLTYDRRLSKRYTSFLKTPPRSLLGVPIMHGDKVIGVLEVVNKSVAGKAPARGLHAGATSRPSAASPTTWPSPWPSSTSSSTIP